MDSVPKTQRRHFRGMLDLPLRIFTVRKRSCGKVIFSEACVKNSVHRGGGGIPACIAGGIPACLVGLWGGGISKCLAGLQAHIQGGSSGVWPRGVSRPTSRGGGLQVHTGGLQAHTRGVSRPIPGGVSRPTPGMGGISACTEADTPPPADGHCCWPLAS